MMDNFFFVESASIEQRLKISVIFSFNSFDVAVLTKSVFIRQKKVSGQRFLTSLQMYLVHSAGFLT